MHQVYCFWLLLFNELYRHICDLEQSMMSVFNLHKWYWAINFILFLASFRLVLYFLTLATLLVHCLQIVLLNLFRCISILEKSVMLLFGIWLAQMVPCPESHPLSDFCSVTPQVRASGFLLVGLRGGDLPPSHWPACNDLVEAAFIICLCQALRPVLPIHSQNNSEVNASTTEAQRAY